MSPAANRLGSARLWRAGSASRRNELLLTVSCSRAVNALKVRHRQERSSARVTRRYERDWARVTLTVEGAYLLRGKTRSARVALGLAALAGVNLYLTVFATGLAIHFHWITLAPQYQSLEVLGNPWIISIAGVLYFLEFFADKIPWVDSIWDAVHTVIRPIGGASARDSGARPSESCVYGNCRTAGGRHES